MATCTTLITALQALVSATPTAALGDFTIPVANAQQTAALLALILQFCAATCDCFPATLTAQVTALTTAITADPVIPDILQAAIIAFGTTVNSSAACVAGPLAACLTPAQVPFCPFPQQSQSRPISIKIVNVASNTDNDQITGQAGKGNSSKQNQYSLTAAAGGDVRKAKYQALDKRFNDVEKRLRFLFKHSTEEAD